MNNNNNNMREWENFQRILKRGNNSVNVLWAQSHDDVTIKTRDMKWVMYNNTTIMKTSIQIW